MEHKKRYFDKCVSFIFAVNYLFNMATHWKVAVTTSLKVDFLWYQKLQAIVVLNTIWFATGRQTGSIAPNSCHWLSQYCYVGLVRMVKKVIFWINHSTNICLKAIEDRIKSALT